jgi:hypothetical protein
MSHPATIFYPVLEHDIIEAERQLERSFPESLKAFWRKHGYGFVELSRDGRLDSDGESNRFSDPLFIAEMFENSEAWDIADIGDAIPVFEIYHGYYMMLNTCHGEDVIVSNADIVMAKNIEEFLEKLLDNPLFYEAMEERPHIHHVGDEPRHRLYS